MMEQKTTDPKQVKKRIKGIDVSRAIAIFGMILVNFSLVLGKSGNPSLRLLAEFFQGKAAALFVVLAGVGISMHSSSERFRSQPKGWTMIHQRLAKRAVILFIIGLSFIMIWPADILHFYGVYILLTLFFLRANRKWILVSAIGIIFLYPFLFLFWDYETAWNFDMYTYADLWTLSGFIRNLFFNGFHPVIPWTAFILIGLWFGKGELENERYIKRSFGWGTGIFIIVQTFILFLRGIIGKLYPDQAEILSYVLGTEAMPPLPFYMIAGSSLAIAIISGCILLEKYCRKYRVWDALYKTGQLALTFYVAHVMVGMGIPEIVKPGSLGSFSIQFSLLYALLFSLACIGFAVIWRKYHELGPLEWVMRKITD